MAFRSFLIFPILVAFVSISASSISSARAEDDAQQVQQDIEKQEQAVRELYGKLNQMNPMAQMSPVPDAPGPAQTGQPQTTQPQTGQLQAGQPSALSSDLLTQLEWIRKIYANPWVQKYIKVLTDPNVQRDVRVLINHPQRLSAVYWELGWFLFILMVKVWRTMKAKGFFAALFVQLWTYSLFFFGLIVLIPRLVFGTAYSQLIHSVLAALH